MIPKSIKVGPIKYRVTTSKEDWMFIEHDQGRKGDYGFTKPELATIYINAKFDIQTQRSTLLHEAMHAITQSIMGRPDWSEGSLGEDASAREESVISMLEAPLLMLLRDNPSLVKFLTEAHA